MGIVLKQSFRNSIWIYLGFALGGINTLFLYTKFMNESYYGLVTFLLSSANIIMPLIAFGSQYTIIKFFSSYSQQKDQDRFMVMALFLPIVVIIPFALFGTTFYTQIASYLSVTNDVIADYVYVIYLVAIATAYFEVFHAWAKVQMASVFGVFMRELFTRICVFVLLILLAFGVIQEAQFIQILCVLYFVRMFIMMGYAFYLYFPSFQWKLPENYKEIFRYSLYIILAGSAGSIVLDIDKVMIGHKELIENTAFYAVAVFIGSVIDIPSRAMIQIVNPITAKLLNEEKYEEVKDLYQKSSINLFVVSGLLFLLINLNVHDLYLFIETYLGKPDFSKGIWVVLVISLVKLYHNALGNNSAIIANSNYYTITFYISIFMAVGVMLLNKPLIDAMGMEGAAWSTLIVVVLANSFKLYYVRSKFQMFPFQKETLKLVAILLFCYLVFRTLPMFWNPILSIILKSFIIGITYLLLVYYWNISKDLNALVEKLFLKQKNRH